MGNTGKLKVGRLLGIMSTKSEKVFGLLREIVWLGVPYPVTTPSLPKTRQWYCT
jgi:hypothetical protein